MIFVSRWLAALWLLAMPSIGLADQLRGTGNLGLVIERATGSVLIVDTTARQPLGRVDGVGDLSHASVVFSPDQRYGYVFGRDGGLTKIDLLTATVAARVVQAGNSIGGAISDDGELIAVSNYEPGGVRVFDARTLALEDGRPRRSAGPPLCLCALQRRRDLDRRPFQRRDPRDHPADRSRQAAL
jgi:protein NirF